MVCLALLVGVFGGIGSVLFRAIIAFCHNLFFFGRISLDYDPLTHTAASPWGALIILVPVVGAVIVTWIIKTLAPEARGHGVPEVMNAIYYREGRIRPVLVGAKAVASAISIGTGGSVGREGPIIQIGSAFASTLGQIINMPARQRVVLVSAGAAAGIAATFNAPIGGLAFAIELMLVSISARTVSLVALATVTATYIGRFYTGMHPTFNVPGLVNIAYDHVLTFYSLLLCVPLGLIMGLVATLFIHSIYWAEDHFDAKIKNQYLRHMSGMLMVGVVIYLLMQTTSHYYVDGVGYATIMDILTDTLTNPGLLLALFAAKLLATSLTLGSGASGGVFSPSLFLGATFGAAFGAVMAPLFPSAHLDPVIFAIAGMAAMISGTTGAVITAITMMFEQTYDYSAMLPVIITVALAYAVRSHLTPESIYTLKLVRRGVTLPRGLQAAVSSSRVAASIMSRDFQVIERDNLSEWQATHRPGESPRYTIIAESGQLYGIARDELTYLMDTTDLENLVDSNIFMVTAMTAWPVLMRGIKKTQSDVVLVMRRRRSNDVKDIIGVITAREIFAATRDEMELVE
jgi:CIC family chloride channel protein